MNNLELLNQIIYMQNIVNNAHGRNLYNNDKRDEDIPPMPDNWCLSPESWRKFAIENNITKDNVNDLEIKSEYVIKDGFGREIKRFDPADISSESIDKPKIKENGKLYQKKQLMLIPSRFAIEMQERGWLLRDDIIWHKPNRIPASVTDRFNNTYENVFHFTINKQYFFDLDAVKVDGQNGRKKNPGDVWYINTQPLDGDHTATYPEKLVERIVLCGSPEGGTVLDPFLGTGTTWVVCHHLQRKCIGFEINPDYYDYAQGRFKKSYEGTIWQDI